MSWRALHIPFYYLLQPARAAGDPCGLGSMVVTLRSSSNVYALAPSSSLHAFAPAALIMFASAGRRPKWYDIRQIPSLTNAPGRRRYWKQRQRDAEFVRERLQELIILAFWKRLLENRAQPLDNEQPPEISRTAS